MLIKRKHLFKTDWLGILAGRLFWLSGWDSLLAGWLVDWASWLAGRVASWLCWALWRTGQTPWLLSRRCDAWRIQSTGHYREGTSYNKVAIWAVSGWTATKWSLC